MLSLWDLIKPRRRPRVDARVPAPLAPVALVAGTHQKGSPRRRARNGATMVERYEAMARELLAEHGIRVRKWRSGMSGVAWQVRYRDGTISRLIEAPQPRGPMSAAVFLHEIAHHVIGFNRFHPRCLEEYHAWAWALLEMERRGITITAGVRKRMHDSLAYAVAKARRRGLRRLPTELVPFSLSLSRR